MISVTAPIERAISRMKQVLFNPFDVQKWFVMGFCAFLASLVDGGIGGGGPRGNPTRWDTPCHQGELQQVSDWVLHHLPVVIGVGILVLAVFLATMALFQWLGSRGQFMFLDNVVRNRAAVVEPWHRFRDLGNDLFRFRFLLVLFSLGYFLVLGGLGWWIAKPDFATCHFGGSALAAVVVTASLALLGIGALVLVSLLLSDFVVPVMYHRNLGTGQAFGVLWGEIIPGHGGAFVCFFLMKLLLGIVAIIIVALGTCVTCCIAALPYVSSVVFLPIFIFFRGYSLYFLEQFGEQWRLMDNAPAAQE
jgi:hypothetical protein